MSQELKDFVSAFGSGMNIGSRIQSRRSADDRWKISKNNPYSPSNDPNGELASHDGYTGRESGFGRLGRKIGQFGGWASGQTGAGGSYAPAPTAQPGSYQDAPTSDYAGVSDGLDGDYGGYTDDYAEGGEVPPARGAVQMYADGGEVQDDQGGTVTLDDGTTVQIPQGGDHDPEMRGRMTRSPELTRNESPMDRLQRATGTDVYSGTSYPPGGMPQVDPAREGRGYYDELERGHPSPTSTRLAPDPGAPEQEGPGQGVIDADRFGGYRRGSARAAVPLGVQQTPPESGGGADESAPARPQPATPSPVSPSNTGATYPLSQSPPRSVDVPSSMPGKQAVPMAPAGAGPGAGAGATGGGGGGGVTPAGKGNLRDQSRTSAFDENADHDDPDNVLRDAIHGGLMYATHVFHLDGSGAAIPGSDPHTAGGQRALMSGVGAPDRETMDGLNRVVQLHDPQGNYAGIDGQSKMAIKRMEIMYRNMMQTGQTDKANKMAFEIMQYSAGVASKLGTQAVQAYRSGNLKAATDMVIKATDSIPDGRNVRLGPDGKTAIVTNQNTGAVIQEIPYTPQMVFQAAMGLSNRSLYWQMLAGRAAMSPDMVKGRQAAQKAEQAGANLELTRARIAKLKQPPKGRAAAAGPPSTGATSSILAAVDDATGHSEPPAPAPTQGGGENQPEPAEPADPAMQDAMSGAMPVGGDAPPGQGLQPGQLPRPADAPPVTRPGSIAAAIPNANPDAVPGMQMRPPVGDAIAEPPPTPEMIAAGAKPKVPQKDGSVSTEKTISFEQDGKHYVVPTIVNGKSLTPEEAMKAFDEGQNKPLGVFKSEDEATAFAESRSKALDKATGGPGVLHKGPSQPADGSLDDPQAIPDVVVGREKREMEPFSDPHPLEKFKGKNPYTQMLSGVDPRTGKPSPELAAELTAKGKNLKTGIIARQAELNRKVVEWNKAKTAHEKEFKAGVAADDKQAMADEKAERGKLALGPEQAERYAPAIQKAFEDRAAAKPAAGAPPTNIYNDGTVEAKDLHELGLKIATHNPDTTPDEAARLVGSMMRIDTANQKARPGFTVKGYAPGKKNVIVQVGDDEVKMPVATYKKMNTLLNQRWDKLQKKTAEGPTLTQRGLKVAEDAVPTGKEAVDYVFKGGLPKDAIRSGIGAFTAPYRAVSGAVDTLKPDPSGGIDPLERIGP